MNTKDIGAKAALLSAVEVGLGSVLHGLSVPFAGHLLSLNQGFLLAWSVRTSGERAAAGPISTTAALLKSLAPAGKKLTPMLAIAMQGQLFALGPLLLGTGPVGAALGVALLCLWGFLQPLLIYGLIFGSALVNVADFYLKLLNELYPISEQDLLAAVAGLVLFKIALGFIVALLAYRLPERHIEAYTRWALQRPLAPRAQSSSPWRGALKDLLHPLFICSWLLTVIFFVFAQGAQASAIWVLLRPLAIGFLVFLGLRLLPLDAIVRRLQQSHPRTAQALEEARRIVEGRDE